jgi:ubiquitin carboxyl-terminal hydrolase 8
MLTCQKFCARLNAEWGTERQQDANDFYVFVMEYLHEDLNVLWRNLPAHVLSKKEEENREGLPMATAAGIEWDRWSKRERSLISDLFAGQHASQLRCLTCRRTSTTYEPWFNLSVEIPLREAGVAARLEDCLSSYCQEERLAKGQEWSCPHCRTTRDATKRIMLTKAPQYLVVHLKRFHMDGGSARKDARIVDFPLQGLDLGPWMLPPARDEGAAAMGGKAPDQSIAGPFRYNAYAVVEHLGRGLHSGHYIALVHDRPRGVWRRFDDSIVTDRQSIRPDGAYLIFYERINRI